ncbi:MAG: DUF3306 domain-containing protein [Burkholderiales bacterium]
MSEEKEAFLDRWSRLKREQPEEEKPFVPQAKQEPPAPLPPVDKLKPDSDFTPFMDPRVDPETRRSALKKLFADAHYNVPDPFEAYSEDYTKSEPIPEKILKAINRVRDVAVKGEEKVAEEERLAEQVKRAEQAAQADKAEAPTQAQEDVPGRQDA